MKSLEALLSLSRVSLTFEFFSRPVAVILNLPDPFWLCLAYQVVRLQTCSLGTVHTSVVECRIFRFDFTLQMAFWVAFEPCNVQALCSISLQ